MKRLCVAFVGLLSGIAQAQQPAPAEKSAPTSPAPAPATPTYESLLAEGKQLRARHRERQACDAYLAAARLATSPASKAFALGEAAELALTEQWFRLATESSCQALELLTGAPRASHLYNLGRAAEAVSASKEAIAFYQTSLAVRPNATVAARLKALNASETGSATADSWSAFCSAALRPRTTVPSDFPGLAEQVAKRLGQQVKFIQIRALGRQGEQYPVAFLCGANGGPGAWILSVDTTHRYLVAFESVGGRDELDACQEEDTRRHILVGHGRHNALQFYAGHRGGYADYRVAVRGGRPVIVWQESLDDARAGDSVVVQDFDKQGRAFPSADAMMTKVRLLLLDPNNLNAVEYSP